MDVLKRELPTILLTGDNGYCSTTLKITKVHGPCTVVANGPKLGDEVGSIVQRARFRSLNDAEIDGPAVLTNVFIRIAVIAGQVHRQLREQGDQTSIPPFTKYNYINLVHLFSPSSVG